MRHQRTFIMNLMFWMCLGGLAGSESTNAAPGAQLPEPGAVAVVNLASDTAWTLRLDDGAPRPIIVPGGGWNSDQQHPPIQVMREVQDFVRYERTITIPAEAKDGAVKLRFGAVAHGCEVLLDGKLVGTHHGPQIAFEMDLTAFAKPGKPQTLQVKAYHRRHYLSNGDITATVAVGWDYPDGDDVASKAEAEKWCKDWHGQSKVGYGITRSITLVVLPAIHVDELLVRTSVAQQQMSADIWIRNETDGVKTVKVGGSLTSWNQKKWNYPSFPPLTVDVAAHATTKVTLGPVAWKLGPDSYWWPNIPFQEKYLAQLHVLNVQLKGKTGIYQDYPLRFGFVEHSEGPYYYQVNGVRVTTIGDATAEGQVSFYDSYVSPAWLPPTGPGTGAPESWRRYMRVGINANRLHCSPPTEYMMQAADEVGFLVIPEAPIWGNGLSRYSAEYSPQTYHDMGRACRNHPSIARYSLTNEVRDNMDLWRPAVDDMREVDDVHPLVFENGQDHGKLINGIKGGHACQASHYQDINEKITPEKGICAMGENFWTTDGMGIFAVGVRTLRMNDWAHMSGWSWINYWPNFLQGMNHELHACKSNNASDRRDGIDGWGSPIVRFVQQSCDPYLVQDHLTLTQNPGEPLRLGEGKIQWPYVFYACAAGKPVERQIEVFNGGLSGNSLTVRWSAHWDKSDGPLAVAGSDIPCVIEPGFHATKTITFTAPALSGQEERLLYLVLESRKDGQMVFHDDSNCLMVHAKILPSSAQFLERDATTKGNWRGVYGAEGNVLAAKKPEMPAFAQFIWKNGEEWIFEQQTTDVRALAFFLNDGQDASRNRISAQKYSERLGFEINVGQAPRRLSVYFLDWDHKNREQDILIEDETGRLLDKQSVKEFAEGIYLSWKVQGKVRFTAVKNQGPNACVSGIFLDPVKK